MDCKLSILIATVNGRENFIDSLTQEFNKQIGNLNWGQVEVIVKKDNKEISIGAKRQQLLEEANGEYVVSFDDDDWPFPHYTQDIISALDTNPDCVGMLIHMTTNGVRPQTCCHSLRNKEWANGFGRPYDYLRNVTHFNPVKRYLALIAGFKDMRHGEDKDYSDRVSALCKKEYFIDKRLFHYRYVNTMPHKQKYGIQ